MPTFAVFAADRASLDRREPSNSPHSKAHLADFATVQLEMFVLSQRLEIPELADLADYPTRFLNQTYRNMVRWNADSSILPIRNRDCIFLIACWKLLFGNAVSMIMNLCIWRARCWSILLYEQSQAVAFALNHFHDYMKGVLPLAFNRKSGEIYAQGSNKGLIELSMNKQSLKFYETLLNMWTMTGRQVMLFCLLLFLAKTACKVQRIQN